MPAAAPLLPAVLLYLLEEGVVDLVSSDLAQGLASGEDHPVVLATGNAIICVARLARTVDHTAHDRDGEVVLEVLELFLDLRRHPDHVESEGARAARAGDDVGPAVPEVEGREDLVRNRYLLDRVLRERDADGVSYSIGQELPEGRGALYGAWKLGAGLRDAEVQRRVRVFAELLVRLDHLGDVARLQGDLEVEEAHLLGDLDLVKRARNERLVFRKVPEPLLDGPRIDPDAHGGSGLLALLDDLAVAVVAPDVAGVDADARRACVGRAECHTVVEVDVGDQGHGRTPDDLPEAFERLRAVHGDAHEVSSGRVQVVDLLHRRLDVV